MTLFRRPWIEDARGAHRRRMVRDDLNPFRRLLADDKYRAPDEPVIRLRRHHWMAAILPFFPPLVLIVLMGALAAEGMWWLTLAGVIVITVDMVHRIPRLSGVGVVWVAAIVAAFWVLGDPATVTFFVFLASLARAIYKLVEFYTVRLYLTDRRIFRVWGLLTRRAATLPLRSLTDLSFDETIIGKALQYGHFRVESAGQDQALSVLRYVELPWDFYQTVMALAPPATAVPEDVEKDSRTVRLAERWRISLTPPGPPDHASRG